MPTIISVENLSKQYSIGTLRQYNSFRDIFDEKVRSFFKAKDQTGVKAQNTIWALQDVSFDVQEGEVLGIIGRNGAGKSTLLKILSRITEPTEGLVRMRGRVASLLEVGTGFSGELTGRENIFLNGAILGMKKAEIIQKFDEIVAFAEIEKFIDTPVKRYSSGMYMRLAFAVAAHLEPDILIVDEVLAVGDAQFQKKCLNKMEDVSQLGRTVLFVSHNMNAIRRLCSRAILLRAGRLSSQGIVTDVVEQYLREDVPSIGANETMKKYFADLPADRTICWRSITLRQNDTVVGQSVENGDSVEIAIEYEVLERTTGLRVFFDLQDNEETLLLRSFHDENAEGIPIMEPGVYSSTATIPAEILAPINYILIVRAGVHNVRYCNPTDGIRVPLSVVHTGNYNRAYLGDAHQGKFAMTFEWKTTRL